VLLPKEARHLDYRGVDQNPEPTHGKPEMADSFVPEGRGESENVSDFNGQVRRLADGLPDSAETKFGFSCQCGCGTVVALTARNFDADGAWADGHKPDTTSDLESAPAVP
jgi:hypothetical protein